VRTAYHEQLTALTMRLGEIGGLVGAAMGNATQALLHADLLLAEQVIDDHEQIVVMSAAPPTKHSKCWRCRRP
jgi:phosphate transport system protein